MQQTRIEFKFLTILTKDPNATVEDKEEQIRSVTKNLLEPMKLLYPINYHLIDVDKVEQFIADLKKDIHQEKIKNDAERFRLIMETARNMNLNDICFPTPVEELVIKYLDNERGILGSDDENYKSLPESNFYLDPHGDLNNEIKSLPYSDSESDYSDSLSINNGDDTEESIPFPRIIRNYASDESSYNSDTLYSSDEDDYTIQSLIPQRYESDNDEDDSDCWTDISDEEEVEPDVAVTDEDIIPHNTIPQPLLDQNYAIDESIYNKYDDTEENNGNEINSDIENLPELGEDETNLEGTFDLNEYTQQEGNHDDEEDYYWNRYSFTSFNPTVL